MDSPKLSQYPVNGIMYGAKSLIHSHKYILIYFFSPILIKKKVKENLLNLTAKLSLLSITATKNLELGV